MKRVIALVAAIGLASCAHQKPQTRETMQGAAIGAAVITAVMLISLAVPCENCSLDDATSFVRSADAKPPR